MTNKEHATKIIDILHSREFMKDADGYYDSIRDRENLIRLTQEYLDKNFPPAFSEVVSPAEPTDAEKQNALDKSYNLAGHNAYYGRGFRDGYDYLLNWQKAKAGSGGTPV